MGFNIFGIGKNNSSVNDTKEKTNEKRFGIKKGDKIGPLKKDTIVFSTLTPEQELDQEVKRLSGYTRGSREVFEETIKKVAKKGTEETPELLEKRIAILSRCNSKDFELIKTIMFQGFKKDSNACFLLDNLEEIKKIIEKKQVSSTNYYGSLNNLLKSLTPENYLTFLEYAENDELMGDDFATLVIYKSKPHNIEFGDETVTVDSSEIISLISGQQSISTVRGNSYTKFNETVDSLIAKDYKRNGQEYYYKIVEGILSQKPELAKIAADYNIYASSFRKKDITREAFANKIKNYFIQLAKDGTLPREIQLRTIVPDENALDGTEMTLKLFLLGKTVSQEK